MYSRNQASKLTQEFWTVFGAYMKPVPSADGGRVNWQNYRTGVRHLYFRMQADRSRASISIEIQHPDPLLGELYFEQLQALRPLFQNELGESWVWLSAPSNETSISEYSVRKELEGVNVLNREHWPRIISFLKPRMIALDGFWSQAKYGFEGLC
ncbi:protein of unknown function [Cyclobacterium xiamenense]|jgi:hypothetical protein|uniref:DUF4268 domain-containing protein n=1 Tax=Cyclobacterium xiamenense TaxID=1297121 RepID=A0A1H6YD93_9BACT|nr:DUF4268 domain-containing protein [Cyclobacterium xiamenense]SEJ39209.1 protein of unknown function [Cyclobacterium xiamenense]